MGLVVHRMNIIKKRRYARRIIKLHYFTICIAVKYISERGLSHGKNKPFKGRVGQFCDGIFN